MAKANSGAVVVRIEARPLETCCSPQLMSRKGSTRLMTLCTRRCSQMAGEDGRRMPRSRTTASRMSAASAILPAVRLAGGIVSTATLIQVKELPHRSASSTSRARSIRVGRGRAAINRSKKVSGKGTPWAQRILLDPDAMGKDEDVGRTKQHRQPRRAIGEQQQRELQRDDRVIGVPHPAEGSSADQRGAGDRDDAGGPEPAERGDDPEA